MSDDKDIKAAEERGFMRGLWGAVLWFLVAWVLIAAGHYLWKAS